jgi:hypothetical protein
MNCNTENEENNLQNSINTFDNPSESLIPIITPFRRINIIVENVTTINDKDNFNALNNNIFDYNNIININDFEKNNYNFQYNNSIFERNNKDNLINVLPNVSNENSNKITVNTNNENIEKSELKINSIKIEIQNKNLLKAKRTRGKRKSKNEKIQDKPRSFNNKWKFRNIVIDSIFNHINKKLQRFNFEFWKLDFNEIKGKKYEELKDKKLRQIFSIASRKNYNDLDYNKKIIAEIDKLEDSELNAILELKLFDVYYHILIKETDVLKGLKEEYQSLKEKEILKNEKKTILKFKGFEEAETFYKNNV